RDWMQFTYPITASTSPFWTLEPSLQHTCFTVPETGARMEFSIFMASRTITTSPSFTVSPSFTAYFMTIPGIGASSFVPPATGAAALGAATGAAAGAAAGLGAGAGAGLG